MKIVLPNPASIAPFEGNVIFERIEELPKELILEIFTYLSAEQLSHASCVNRIWNVLASETSLWLSLLKQEKRIRNLDQYDLKSIGFPQKNPVVHPRALLVAARIACRASENGTVTILTIPAGWSFNDLEKLSRQVGGIKSAQNFLYDTLKKLLIPIKEEQTVILTDTVIHDSRRKSVESQEKCLEANGFEKELPDALIVLTMSVLTHIITEGQVRMYYNNDSKLTYTRCAQTTVGSFHVLIGSTSSNMFVSFDSSSAPVGIVRAIGVGGQQKFKKAIPKEVKDKHSWFDFFQYFKNLWN